MTRAEIVAGAREAIQHGSRSFRAASRLFDPLTRERAWLLYCWCRYCDDVSDGQIFGRGQGEAGDVAGLIADTRRAAAGEMLPQLPFQALTQLMRERPLPQRLLDDHLEGFALDARGWRPESEADLIRYCYHVAGAVGCMMAVVMGVEPDDAETLERASSTLR